MSRCEATGSGRFVVDSRIGTVARLGRASGAARTALLAATVFFVSVSLAAQASAQCAGPCSKESLLTGLAHPPAWAAGKDIHFYPASQAAAAWAPEPVRSRNRASGGIFGPGLTSVGLESEYEPEVVEPLIHQEGASSVEHAPVVHLILWGSNFSKTTPGQEVRAMLEKLFYGLTSSGYQGIHTTAYQGILTQYFDRTGRVAPQVTFTSADIYTDEGKPAPSEVNASAVGSEVEEAIRHNAGWTAEPNAQFLVVTAPGTTYAKGFDEGFCAYHMETTNGAAYSFVPYQGDAPFSYICAGQYNPGGNAVRKTSATASHEYAESVIEPSPDTGWVSEHHQEIGDLCASENKVELPDGAWVQNLYDEHSLSCAHEDREPALVYAMTQAPSGVTETSAMLNGTVNAEETEGAAGKETKDASYYFEYEETGSSMGINVPANPEPFTGKANTPVNASVSGLKPDTRYTYRINAANRRTSNNAPGTMAGQAVTFTTGGVVPTVTNVQSNAGAEAGGTEVAISGTNFVGVTSVKFGSASAKAVSDSANLIMAVAPAGTGTVDVTVSINGVASAAGPADRYTYRPASAPLAWGANGGGQLGNGKTEASNLPIEPSNASETRSVVAGKAFGLAQLASGEVTAWGNNEFGQLGNGGTESSQVPTPVCLVAEHRCKAENRLGYPTEVKAIAAGEAFALALRTDGSVVTWGENSAGQLGDGNESQSDLPVSVKLPERAVAIAAAGKHSVAVLEGGEVWTWGANGSGQLGNGNTKGSDVPVPVCLMAQEGVCPVADRLTGAVTVAAGESFSLALLKDGTVRSWGAGAFGQLGNDSNSSSDVPVAVCEKPERSCGPETQRRYLKEVTSIASGATHGIALLANGEVRAWGANILGQLGDGNESTSEVPVEVKAGSGGGALKEVSAIAAGGSDSSALMRNGTIKDWGGNREGQLGDGNAPPPESCLGAPCNMTPVEVGAGLGGATALADGGEFSLAAGALPPTVSNVQPNTGPESGGTEVTISGSHLIGVAIVKFGPFTASAIIGESPNSLTVLSPPGAGSQNVTVTTAAGTSPTVPGDEFVYRPGRGAEAWGGDTSGQLGNGTQTSTTRPVTVSEVSNVRSLAAGYNHSLALLEDGEVVAWGKDTEGQLGNGAMETDRTTRVPVCAAEEPGCTNHLRGVSALAAGEAHSLALTSSGEVLAWGQDTRGQLGDGNLENSDVPVHVTLNEPAVAIAAGEHFSVALTRNHTVEAWGQNNYGQLGDGEEGGEKDLPQLVKLPAREPVVAIAAGGNKAFALLQSGRVMSWGESAYGALGDGVSGNKDIPVFVCTVAESPCSTAHQLSGVTQVEAGWAFGVALMSDGTLRSWGSNLTGELGDGKTTGSSIPVQVKNLTQVTAVAAGGFFAIAELRNGTLMDWGQNVDGELGNGETTGPEHCVNGWSGCSELPIAVKGVEQVTNLSPGLHHAVIGSAAVGTVPAPSVSNVQPNTGTVAGGTTVTISGTNLASATVVQFGGKPAASVRVDSASMITAVSPEGSNGPVEVSVATPSGDAGAQFTYRPLGNVAAWGENQVGELGDGTFSGPETCEPEFVFCSKHPIPVEGLPEAIQLAGGSEFSYALLKSGKMMSWGNNVAGELGIGSAEGQSRPTSISTLSGVTAMSAGYNYGLAVANGAVDSWGLGEQGQLGLGPTQVISLSPKEVSGLSSITAVAAGGEISVALRSNGEVWAWGENRYGELGDGTTSGPERCSSNTPCSNYPVMVSGLSEAVAVAAGKTFAMALLSDGTVMTWGRDNFGQLGNGKFEKSDLPVKVDGLAGVTAIAAKGNDAYALLSNGTVMAWGDDFRGELGGGKIETSNVPIHVSGLNTVTQLATGSTNCLALLADGTVWAWGDNRFGQIGDGSSAADAYTPVETPGLSQVAQVAAGYESHSLALAAVP